MSYLRPELMADREVILEAVKQNGQVGYSCGPPSDGLRNSVPFSRRGAWLQLSFVMMKNCCRLF